MEDADSPTSLEARVLKWLADEGYPSELRAGNLFRAHGWVVDHGRTYKDVNTGKSRELDLLARRLSGDVKQLASVEFAVECKRSHGKPWVAFDAPRLDREFSVFEYPVVDGMSWQALFFGVVGEGNAVPWLLRPAIRAHGLVRALGNRDGAKDLAPHAALQGAIGAALALGKGYAEFSVKLPPVRHLVNVVIPLVVLDGDLLIFEIDATGQERIARANKVCVTTPAEGAYRTSVNVWVVTLDGLSEFLADAAPVVTDLLSKVEAVAPQVVKALAERSQREGPDAAFGPI